MPLLARTAAAAAALLLAAQPANAAPLTKLATFDGAPATTFKWADLNDPVMGGRSTSTFAQRDNLGVFNGTCAIVPFLKAPGFAKIATASHGAGGFADVSAHLAGYIELRVRSSTPGYQGFRMGFAAKDVPRTSMYGGGSFKAGFNLSDTTDFQIVKIPFSDFSYDWSGFTGRCDTKDPNGQQHHCCSASDGHKYCPKAKYLAAITDVEVWAEGAVGDFHLEIDYIGANDDTESATESAAPATDTTLCRFDGKGPSMKWVQKNDPVMGGKSTGTFTVVGGVGVFDGDVVDVPFLKAPGFIKADASGSFPDASKCGGIYLMARSSTNYTGYRFSFGTAKAPGGGFFSFGYKTHFDPPMGTDFQRVELPFHAFSDAWNDATGNLDHTCAENKIYCPSTKQLQNFQTMGVWGEGVGGKVHLEIDEVGVFGC